MRNFLKFLLVLCVIAVIMLLGYAGKYVNDYGGTNTTASSSANNQNTTVSDKTEINNITNKDDVETKKEEKEPDDVEEQQPIVKEENNISNEDKAKELAKKEYGSSNGVYFRIEQIQSNGVYIVSVRDSETTKDLVWYTVDVINGIVK